MANTKDSQAKTDTELPFEAINGADATPVISATNKHGFKKTLVSLLALISLIAFVLSLSANFKLWQLQNQKTSFDEGLNKLIQQQSSMDTQLSSMKQNMDDMLLESQNKITELNRNLQSALSERLYQKQDWLLLKARHYLELAQVNAHWGDDPKIAIALLQQADSILQELTLQKIFPVRQVIAKEIVQLQSLSPIDIPGILSQLDAAQGLVSKLPVVDDTANATQQKTNQPILASQNRWQQSMSFLEKLIVVKHYDGDTEPALSPIHKAVLRDNIRINLQEAQWAVLQNNTKLYQQSLSRALQNIERIYEKDTPAIQTLLKQIQTLQQTTLRLAMPVLDQSLQLLNQVITSKADLRALPAAPAGDKKP